MSKPQTDDNYPVLSYEGSIGYVFFDFDVYDKGALSVEITFILL